MKKSKKILFSLGAVLPLAAGVALTSCSQVMPPKDNTGYQFAADADLRKAAAGNIGTINQVKNVVENSLQLAEAVPSTSSSVTLVEGDGASGTGTTGTGNTGDNSGTGSAAGTGGTGMQNMPTQDQPQVMLSGAWKHFYAIAKDMQESDAKTKATAGLTTFRNTFKAKFADLLNFAGGKTLTDGSASLDDLNTARDSFVAKWKEVFKVYNELGTALGQSVTFDTTKTLEELTQASQGLSSLYKINQVDVYNFAKPVAGSSYNDLARFFEALNGNLGIQFANNATKDTVFKLFGNTMALIMSRQLRIIDGAINSVLLTTPANKKDGVETKLLANINKNSTIKSRYDTAVATLKNVKELTDKWANSSIITKAEGQQSKLEMAATKGNEQSKALLTKVVNAIYGNTANMPAFAAKGLLKSVTDLTAQLDGVKSLVSASYTKLADFLSVYKMTNSSWMDGVGIFVNSSALSALTTDAISKLAPAEGNMETDKALFDEVKAELTKLVADTASLSKNGGAQDMKSAFYLNQMVRSITSDNQARLASMGEGVDGFKAYANNLIA
ncbi:hypothetical protein [[Mycoplasma] imitans]|uniref:hypothetical protein n=1 Tax=[Mycoplasma] imitans TaxID=29560 RepID=UPI0006873EAC|nr:hypothetical protein [[Mycoplasma] imitans]